jgi:hypothetical protein
MIDLQRIFHTGIIVHDLEKAKREIDESMRPLDACSAF